MTGIAQTSSTKRLLVQQGNCPYGVNWDPLRILISLILEIWMIDNPPMARHPCQTDWKSLHIKRSLSPEGT